MLVAIYPSGIGQVIVEEFREAASLADAVAEFCGAYDPPLDVIDYKGTDTGWAHGDSRASDPWAFDYDTGQLVERVDVVRAQLFEDIDEHLSERLSTDVHFEYPEASGKLFGLSNTSILMWNSLRWFDADGEAGPIYPMEVSTFDKLDSHFLTGSVDLKAVYRALGYAVLGERASAQASINAVKAATDIAGSRAAAEPYLTS